MDPKPLKTPDLTPAQVIAAVIAVVGLLVSQGVVDNGRAQLITGIASIVIPIVWVAADAVIRHGRARAFSVPPKGVVAAEDPAPAKAPNARRRRTAA